MSVEKSLAWRATDTIKDKFIEKILQFKDPQYAALMALEFILSMIILAGLLIYIDPKTNVIEPPFNFMIFGAILLVVFQIYRYTNVFREFEVSKRRTSTKILSLELLLSAVVIAGAYLYKDQNVNVLPYPANLIVFLAVLSIPLYFYVKEKFIGS